MNFGGILVNQEFLREIECIAAPTGYTQAGAIEFAFQAIIRLFDDAEFDFHNVTGSQSYPLCPRRVHAIAAEVKVRFSKVLEFAKPSANDRVVPHVLATGLNKKLRNYRNNRKRRY